VLVPTSPATCAAATAVVVDYTVEGAYLGSRVVRRTPAYTVVEPRVLAAAPNRHLTAGMVDALAKVVEVRFGVARQNGVGAAGVAALALCDDLERLIFADGPRALDNPDPDGGIRQLIAEANVLWPGLIGALAGEGAKLAAAHAVHNALTLLPGVKRSLHGEVLAFGILTQLLLEGRSADELARHADLFDRLGCPMTLAALGAGAYWSDADAKQRVLRRACALPSMAQSFPAIGPEELAAAFAEADELATDFSR
jgi:glycerol dehydrogenase